MAKRPERIPIPTKAAHKALALLLARLAKADTSNHQPKSPPDKKNRGKNGKELTKTVDEWEEVLRRTMEEIEEWCPLFTIVLPPKPRERRTNPTRK
jgi:hypothetical protein